MKSTKLRISLLIGTGVVAIMVGGGWKMLSDSNEPSSPMGPGIGGPEIAGPEMGATTLNAYSFHPQSEAPKAVVPAYTVKSYVVSHHPAAPEEQNPVFLDTFEAAPKAEHSSHPHSIITVAQDDGASFSPNFLGSGGSLPPILAGFNAAPNSSGSHGSTPAIVPPHNSNSTPPGNGGGASGGSNGTSNGTPPPDNHGGNSVTPPSGVVPPAGIVPPSGIVPPAPSDSYSTTELPPIGQPVDQGNLNGTPPVVSTQVSAETDSPNSAPPSPVPDNGLTLVLLGISFTALLGLKRRTGCRSS